VERGVMYRAATVAAAVVWALLCLVPNWTTNLPDWWKAVLPTRPINLGLDLQGGIHMVLSVDADKAVQNSVDLLGAQLQVELREKEIATRGWKREGQADLVFELISRQKSAALEEFLASDYPNIERVGAEGDRYRYRLVVAEADGIRQLAIEQALETIRNRVDEFGVSEPTIQRTSGNGILVQLPGVQDPERAKRLIGRTAQLQFRLVSEDEKAVGTEVLSGVEVDPITGRPSAVTYRVEPGVIMAGDVISDARHRPGQFGESPYVAITFDSRGAKIFERVTGESVGRRLAIVLDGKVQSAPVIQERIGGGRAVITGSFTLDEARDLAIVLRAGALPAPVTIAEERSVGPSLGRDSIAAGLRSFKIGGALVVLSMLVYYRMAGLVANLGLAVNLVLLMGVLTAFQATLTLPGIAGILLTMGMAVDANVLINERIREELKTGQSARAALEAGYQHALPAILDSNITTLLAGLVLFQFGSGPVKGFALTLSLGILTTIFGAVFASRVFHELFVPRRAGARMSI
jgi:preprotein translocase subunit SecD